MRRERTRLLAAFDRRLVVPTSRMRMWRPLVGSLLLAAVVAGLFLFRRRVGARPDAYASSVTVRADGATAWSKDLRAGREEIVLEHGVLWIHVEHALARNRAVVVLPDGELEDVGTTFVVSAASGHTTRVAVEEGSVILRIRGRPPMVIASGDTWIADPEPDPSALASVAIAKEAAPVPLPTSSAPLSYRSRPPRPAASADASADFRAAVAALDSGENVRADAAFARFVSEHPRDPRAEDAAYLRVIALQRCGDDDAMKRAARDYLRRYPTGLRRADVERLSGALEKVK
jgi:hypothetical protein